MPWEPGTFLIAEGFDSPVSGYVYKGLGIYMCMKGSPKGQRPPTWSLRHLGSGHTICIIDGKVSDAFPIATEIAECGNWDFDGLKGWVNVDPDIPEKCKAIFKKHGHRLRRTGGLSSESAARRIALARA